MAKVGVSLKIDVSKIEKNRLYKGQKGTYLDATVFIDLDELDQYGNSGMITQNVSKEERQNNVRGAILGNAKVFYKDDSQPQQMPTQHQREQQQQPQINQQHGYTEPPMDFDDDIPFIHYAKLGHLHLVV